MSQHAFSKKNRIQVRKARTLESRFRLLIYQTVTLKLKPIEKVISMPYFKNARIAFNKAVRKVFRDETKNFVTLDRELEIMAELDDDELNGHEIFALEGDFDAWLTVEASKSNLYKSQVIQMRLRNQEIDEAREYEMLEQAKDAILARPDVNLFRNSLRHVRTRYQNEVGSSSSSASYSA